MVVDVAKNYTWETSRRNEGGCEQSFLLSMWVSTIGCPLAMKAGDNTTRIGVWSNGANVLLGVRSCLRTTADIHRANVAVPAGYVNHWTSFQFVRPRSDLRTPLDLFLRGDTDFEWTLPDFVRKTVDISCTAHKIYFMQFLLCLMLLLVSCGYWKLVFTFSVFFR